MKAEIKAGSSANEQDFGYPAPLAVACGRPASMDVVKVLLAAGANPDGRRALPANQDSESPIIQAAIFGNRDVFRLLLNAGANPNVTLWDGMRLPDWLMRGYSTSHEEMIEILKNLRPDVILDYWASQGVSR